MQSDFKSRENPAQLPERKEKKRGHRKKDKTAEPITPRMLELQRKMGLKELLSSVPTQCNVGTKMNAKAYKIFIPPELEEYKLAKRTIH